MKSPNYLERSLAIGAAVALALGASACTGGEATRTLPPAPNPTTTSEQPVPDEPVLEVHDVIAEYLNLHGTDESYLSYKDGEMHWRWVVTPLQEQSLTYDYSLYCKAGALVVDSNDLKYTLGKGWEKDTHTATLKKDPACPDGKLTPADNLLGRSGQIKIAKPVNASPHS